MCTQFIWEPSLPVAKYVAEKAKYMAGNAKYVAEKYMAVNSLLTQKGGLPPSPLLPPSVADGASGKA